MANIIDHISTAQDLPFNYITVQRTDNGKTTACFIYFAEALETTRVTVASHERDDLINRVKLKVEELLPSQDTNVPVYLIGGIGMYN